MRRVRGEPNSPISLSICPHAVDYSIGFVKSELTSLKTSGRIEISIAVLRKDIYFKFEFC